MAEASLLPAIRAAPDAIVVADGTSCRQQIAHGAAREALHVARLLERFLPERSRMTWSIVARDADGSFGVAIASRFFAVGALCVHTRRAVGALSTQALMNPLYGPAGIGLLADGMAPAEVVQRLTDADEGRAQRQLHVIGAPVRPPRRPATQCLDWCGHALHDEFSVAGNMLAGPRGARRDRGCIPRRRRAPLWPSVCIAAMAAGEAAGGDKRGKQAAALRIHGDDGLSAPRPPRRRPSRADRRAAPPPRRRASSASSRSSPAWPSRRDPVGLLQSRRDRGRVEAFARSARMSKPTVPSAVVPEVSR